ncbi:MAG: hypothetical protein EXR05_11980 [Acetobacteraceae bacterium]|nr:hypothetical protein [Acetobacteraceae bacterium]MSP30500.1 hypothetical protein [Acetobacteraceae bacterium]
MSGRLPINAETAARISLREIGDLLVSHQLLEADEIPHMSLREMHLMLAYLAGMRPGPMRRACC